ncbi:MAG: prepilin-type N-terminal cleavage/methylation domain-containing protein [Phycisphaerales bacterium]|nr:prepilin-type N-terminal cleavage/methylation domain-containing protein [Phycisphaerales bacterium]
MTTRMHLKALTRTGFTLIELMVAIVIIGILAALTLSIGSAVLESADRRKTLDTLTLLDAALTEYEQHVARRLTYGQGDGPDSAITDDRPLAGVSRYDIPVVAYGQSNPGGVGFLEEFDTMPEDFSSWETAAANRAGEKLVDRMIDQMRDVQACRDILAKISPAAWVDPNPTNDDPEYDDRYLADAWGRPIVVVFPGRDWYRVGQYSLLNDDETENASRKDGDDTIRTFEERAFGPALGRRTYFMSAGPDRRYGYIGYQQRSTEAFEPDVEGVLFERTRDNLYSYEVPTW